MNLIPGMRLMMVMMAIAPAHSSPSLPLPFANPFTASIAPLTLTQASSPAPPRYPTERSVTDSDPTATVCHTAIDQQIHKHFAKVANLNFRSDTTRAYFISNAEEGVYGEAQFYQTIATGHRFSYDCTVNIRNGQVIRGSYRILGSGEWGVGSREWGVGRWRDRETSVDWVERSITQHHSREPRFIVTFDTL